MSDVKDKIWSVLSTIPDPEVPAISITELGVVRKVELDGDKVIVTITPTYTGCPAMKVFSDDIIAQLKKKGFSSVEIKTVFDPPWTTAWISDEAREKLRKYGIAPPIRGTEDKGELFASGPKVVPCPRCGSHHTYLKSQFGSTACKALYFCDDCVEPFEYFKCI